MRVAFVVPRYGTAIVGGAETAARLFAEHLVSGQGWSVDVLTTCAADFTTWDEVYPAGTETINGVHVERVASEAGRDPSFHPFSAGTLGRPSPGHAGRRRALGRAAGTESPRPRRTSYLVNGRRRRLLSLPLLPDGPRHRTHPRPGGSAPGRPRRAGFAAPGLRPGPHRRRRAGVPDRVRASARAAPCTGGLSLAAAARSRGRRLRCETGRRSAPSRPGPPPDRTSRTWCASAGSTGTRASTSSSTCSPPTRSDTPARFAWSWPARSSTHRPPGPTSTSSARCPRTTSGTCWPAPSPSSLPHPGRPSRWPWPSPGAHERLSWCTPGAAPPSSTAAAPVGASPSPGSGSSKWRSSGSAPMRPGDDPSGREGGPTSTNGSAGPRSSTATPGSSSGWWTPVAAWPPRPQVMPPPSGRRPARSTTGTPRMVTPGRTCQTR